MLLTRRRAAAALIASTTLVALAACSSGSSTATSAKTTVSAAASSAESTPTLDKNVTLVVYNAQHDTLTKAWVAAFTAETGIKVEIRQGSDLTMANQIVTEGSGSPADVFITENSPAMSIVENAGLFSPINKSTLAQVPPQDSPSTGKWTGVAARSTVLAYNPTMLNAADLPKSIMDLQDPKWKNKWGAAPKGADFQAIVSAMLELKGEAATTTWLKALKSDSQAFSGNGAALKAVNAGTVASAIIYHYYWFGDQAKTKENSNNVKLYYFGDKTPSDPGAFLSVSGAGVLASGKHQPEAQAFVKFLTSKAGQQVLSGGDAYEYSIGSGVAPNPALKPLTELNPPAVDPSKLNSPKVVALMTAAGLI